MAGCSGGRARRQASCSRDCQRTSCMGQAEQGTLLACEQNQPTISLQALVCQAVLGSLQHLLQPALSLHLQREQHAGTC